LIYRTSRNKLFTKDGTEIRYLEGNVVLGKELILDYQKLVIYRLEQVNVTYNNYYFYPTLPLREFLFHNSGFSPVSICLPNSKLGIQSGCKVTIRTYSGESHTAYIYGEPTTLLNRIYELDNNSAVNGIVLTDFRSTNLIFNNGYWFEV
jgi:hypothetical protein